MNSRSGDKYEVLTGEYLRRTVRYDPLTGIFTWLVSCSGIKRKEAGTLSTSGYIIITINRKLYYAHILAWLYMTNAWPAKQVDHKNTIENDNRWENLREASQGQNQANKGLFLNNTSGFKGVTYVKKLNKFRARLGVEKDRLHLGYFSSAIKAAIAYDRAALKLHGEFAFTNFSKENYL